ncbi:MAG: protein-glutamate O-methyltransferase [Desulfuromonadaceae bacterium]|nr:protein-glutamate O-methyltransferase [Desulfuromonadaceae bacterium]MDD5105281.1 protein-glutamate O-methyltransferase [Desulfuromonadaceae bacterium]
MTRHQDNSSKPHLPATLSDREFQRFSTFIYDHIGIKMPPAKKTMLEARLQKRLKANSIRSFEEYGDYVFSQEGRATELIHLIDVVTTNKTDFFREPGHFDYMVKVAIPNIVEDRENLLREPLRIWSAGCSTGEEPYTLTMVLSEYAVGRPGFRVAITASDICTEVLKIAHTAIYPEERTDTIPLNLKKKYLTRSREKSRALIRISPSLRSLVSFKRINFMDDDFGISEKMDIIFCRNVVIYFDKLTQQALMRKFHKQLRPGGYLFIGHSETLSGLDVDFKAVASTVYRKE